MAKETTSEHIARDMREGRFPERSEPQEVPAASTPTELKLGDTVMIDYGEIHGPAGNMPGNEFRGPMFVEELDIEADRIQLRIERTLAMSYSALLANLQKYPR